MKWSFVASLLTSAAVLAPISASAKAKTLSSASLISDRLLASRSAALGININKKKDGGDSPQAVHSEAQGTILSMENLGRGEHEAGKAKSLDTLQLSRGLGSGAEGGGSPSQHASVVKTKDTTLPGRPMLANQQVALDGIPVNGKKGPSLAPTTSRTADGSLVMPAPTTPTVGQQHQGETGKEVSIASPSRSVFHRPQAQDTTSLSSSQASEGSLSDSTPSSIGSGGSGGGSGGGSSSSSQEGSLLSPEAVQEYQQLKAEKVRNNKIPPAPTPPTPPPF